MQKVHLAYSLTPTRDGAPLLANPLMALLAAVQQQGSISGASRQLKLSYRHVWGELKRWEQTLGEPLLQWERGQAALLSDFGRRLLYAHEQASARLQPQIEALQAQLERGLALAFDPKALVLNMHSSHDEALSALRVHCAAHQLHLDVQFTGSVDALRSLNDGRCQIAGFHTRLPPQAGSLAARTFAPMLEPGLHKLLGFVKRTQGLIVAKGNPLGVESLADVAERKLRWVSRPVGTGTRVLQEDLLAQSGLAKSALQGYRRTEPSHQAAALAVAQDHADATLGLEAAARAQGLGFVPLVQERYVLVCHAKALMQPAMLALAQHLQSAAWGERLSSVAGYEPLDSGQVLKMTEVLPWWSF
jgi:putative molybdopterin biosynthesis protein